MKKLLLFASLTIGVAGLAQGPISHFAGVAMPAPENLSGDGYNFRYYYRGVFETTPDESATGANASWDFNAVVFDQQELYTNSEPTEAEMLEYPGCNFVSTGSDLAPSTEVGKMFATNDSDGFSILGNTSDMFTLKFSGDGAFIGQFPMNYQDTSTSSVSGTFNYSGPEGDFSGNFTGTVASTYDAYGLLAYPAGVGMDPNPIQVNRLNVMMTLTFGTAEFPDAGTIIQTSHFYYKQPEFGEFPFVRSVRNQISVPMLSINRDVTVLERAEEVLLLNIQAPDANVVSVYPNPVKNVLNIAGFQNQADINIIDLNGRSVMDQKITANSIDLSALQTGMYFVRIATESGTTVKKIIKE